MSTGDRAFIESYRASFDAFLRRLMIEPSLKHSQLIGAFLTSRQEFRENFLPDKLNPWKNMKKVGYLTNKDG